MPWNLYLKYYYEISLLLSNRYCMFKTYQSQRTHTRTQLGLFLDYKIVSMQDAREILR